MSVQAQEESPVTWDIEGWVKAALRNWASGYDEIKITSMVFGGESRISIHVHDRKVATVAVKNLT